MTMNSFVKFSMVAGAAGLMLASIAPAEAGRGVVRNGKGGMAAAGSVNGNTWARGRSVTTSETGATTVKRGGGFKGANGATGSATRSGRFAASGANGSVDSSGSATRNADGSYSGNRSTTATNKATGNTYNGSTTYDSTNGVSRSATCTDAMGNSIACPR
jgi:hypothetical protein